MIDFMDRINIELSNSLFNRLHILAVEYSIPIDVLVNVALKKLIDDVDLLRDLRAGKIKLEESAIYPHDQSEQK